MLKSLITRKLPILLLTTLTGMLPLTAVNASVFDETEVNQDEFIAIAQPFGENKYNLIVIEQIPQKSACWNEIAETSNPVNVDLLLMNFDFTGHCRRSTDANGYSIRKDDEDLGLDYLLSLVEENGQLLLVGTNRLDRSQPPIVIGSAEGLNGDAMKIKLNPGWRFTKRTYQGKVLGHVYFSYDSGLDSPVAEEMDSNSEPTSEKIPEQQPMQTMSEDMNENVNQDNMLPNNKVREILAPNTQTEENANEDNMLPDSRVREILAPQSNIQSHKQLKKNTKMTPLTQNTQIKIENKTWE